MNQKINITDILTKLNETQDLLTINKFSNIDKDLILEKIRKLYEQVLSGAPSNLEQFSVKVKDEVNSSKIDTNEEVPKENIESISIIEELHQTIKPIEISEEKEIKVTTPQYSEELVTEKETKIDKVIAENLEIELDKSIYVSKESKKEEIIEAKPSKASSKTLSDQYMNNSKKTVSDAIIGSEKDNFSRVNIKPLKNIKSAININDRIMFTKVLFNNNPDFYNEVVDKVNNMNELSEALNYLTSNNNFKDETEATEKFFELVHRRFS